jgi:hypothetical protein
MSSKWKKVGDWLKDNASHGVGLVGSLLTGNVKGAIANGISLVSSATGTDDPDKALLELQNHPEKVLKLKELQYQNEDNIRRHIREMEELKLENEQKAHSEAQATIRAGDKADAWYVKATRPGQSWLSLMAALYYAVGTASPDIMILSALLTLPFTYMGLRQHGKWTESVGVIKAAKEAGK